MATICGDPLPRVAAVDVVNGPVGPAPVGPPSVSSPGTEWILRGVVSNTRYVTLAERTLLESRQPPLGRVEATCAALIPLKKSAAWWGLAQDERREILEARSQHIAVGLRYLPAVARRLQHSRDLGEPFDFLTWFEFAPADAPAFDELLQQLRASEEWRYVERECDIRLIRNTVASVP
jgi:hypothetical protein